MILTLLLILSLLFLLAVVMTSRFRLSARVQILDEGTRRRRQRRAIEALEQDNFHADPHANLVLSKKIPRFDQTLDGSAGEGGDSCQGGGKRSHDRAKRSKLRSFEYHKQRFRKDLATLLEEEMCQHQQQQQSKEDGKEEQDSPVKPPPSYMSARAGPSRFPARHICAVCGFPGQYTCVPCGARYCSTRCHQVHEETRCLRWAS